MYLYTGEIKNFLKWTICPCIALVFVFAGVLKATDKGNSLSQILVLEPARVPALRIDFDFNFRNALPAFEKEPAFEDKEIARGLIPTIPPTPFIRNINDNELYLNENQDYDFVTGHFVTYTSSYEGHVVFRDIRVFSRSELLVIPYTINLVTYEHGCAGWLLVKTGWAGELELEGRKWIFSIVDNLDGRINSEDRLFIRDSRQTGGMPLINNCPVPQTMFFSGHSFHLDFMFKQILSDIVLEVNLTEIQSPMGELDIDAGGTNHLRLRNEEQIVLLNDPAGIVSLPTGDYQIDDLVPGYETDSSVRPRFISSDLNVSIKPGQTTLLRVGPPLRNTVEVSRDRNLLRIEYELVGAGGEKYRYYDWEHRPGFSVYKGRLKIAHGTFPFG